MPSNNSTSRRTARRRARRSADKRIASLVTREVVKLIPQIVARVHSLSNSRTPEDVKAEPIFLYKHFKDCDPMPFTGEGGVSQLLLWFDAIEVTLRQSGCPEGFQTTCATRVFQSQALDWWTAERNKRGITATYALTWNELKKLMKDEYDPPHELQKLEDEFWQIKQDKGDNASYTARFKQLSVICPSQVDTPKKAIAKYIRGLPECVGDFVKADKPATIEEGYQLAAEVNDKRVLSKFFSTNPVKQAHQAIIIDSSGESINGSSDDSHKNSSRDSSDGSSENPSKDSSDDTSSGSLDEVSDDTASTREAQPNRKRKEPSMEEIPKPEPLRSVPILAKRAYNGSHPQCLRCTYHHPTGAGCRYCANCSKYGHLTWNCHFGPQH
ncbi:putative transcription factor interactor and regulator CCHC(Zn) family [Helianthus anomalus]